MRTKVMPDYFQCDANIYLATASSYLIHDKLAMGVGAPAMMRRRSPDIDEHFGDAIRSTCGHLGKYGVLLTTLEKLPALGIFQVRRMMNTPVDLELLQYSTDMLARMASGVLNNYTIAMNYPGNPTDMAIFNILEALPNNVELYLQR